MNTIKTVLNIYKSKYGKIRVAFRDGYGFWQHHTYPGERAEWLADRECITDREILQDEIVIETDMNMRKMNRSVSDKQCETLRKYKYAYKRYFSGNKSYHIHVIFPELLFIEDSNDRKILKRLFIQWLHDFDDDVIGKHKVDMQLCGKHLIRIEGGFHHKTGSYKSLFDEHEKDEVNTLPHEVWKRYKKFARVKKLPIAIKYHDKLPEDIKYFMSKRFKDCRKRMAFAIYHTLRRSPFKKIAKELLIQWNIMQGSPLREGHINGIFNHKEDYTPGRRFIKDIMIELKGETNDELESINEQRIEKVTS